MRKLLVEGDLSMGISIRMGSGFKFEGRPQFIRVDHQTNQICRVSIKQVRDHQDLMSL